MLGAERLFVYGQCALEERLRARKVALILKQLGEAVEFLRRLGMLGAERLFVHGQCALEEWPRAQKVALLVQQEAEVVEAPRGVGVLGAAHLSCMARARSNSGCPPARSPWPLGMAAR